MKQGEIKLQKRKRSSNQRLKSEAIEKVKRSLSQQSVVPKPLHSSNKLANGGVGNVERMNEKQLMKRINKSDVMMSEV